MSRKLLLAITVGVASLSTLAVAQNQPDNNGGGGNRQGQGQGGQGGGGGGRNFDPAQMQQRMMERMKEQMKAPDDEWAVISPKLEAVMKAQRDARVGGFGGFGGRGGGGGGGGNDQQPQSEVAKASRELRTTLEAENASPETVAAKLKAYRDARAKAEESLKAAREELKGVLNERQEAVLVMAGMLE